MDDEQEAKLLQFQEITGTEDEALARTVLTRFEWNLEMAIQNYLNEEDGDFPPATSQQIPPRNDPDPGLRHRSAMRHDPIGQSTSHIVRRGLAHVQPNGWLQWCYNLVLMPFRFVWVSTWDLLLFFYRLMFPQFQAVTDPTGDVRRFIEEYETKHGVDHPPFYEGSYSMALNEAKKELKFLIVYLHSEAHQATANFCANTLGRQELRDFIAQNNIIFWGCSVTTPEGHRVSMAMRETTYPFLSLICLRDNKMMIVLRQEGTCRVEELIAYLSVAIQDNENYVNLARQEREQNQFNQLLRQQQEMAFEESLMADRQKDEEKKAADRLKREAEEKEERLKREAQQKLEDGEKLREKIREELPDEPTADTPNIVKVSLKFPCGARLERRFLQTDALKLLHNFTFCQPECPMAFSVVTNFPRKVLPCGSADLSGESASQTFKDAGIQGAVMLLVLNNEA